MSRQNIIKVVIVLFLIITGLTLEISGLLETDKILQIAREHSDNWWLIVLLIVAQAILFTFALAGSLFLWVVAPLYSPLLSAFILAAGGTLGGISAYFFSKRLSSNWIEKIENSNTYKMLHKYDNFFTLFALRIFPAFPHAIVNYSSGILKVKIGHFIIAAFSGIAIKSFIYSEIIYNATSSASVDEMLNLSTLGPLILISVITLASVFIKYKLNKRSNKKTN